MLADSQDSGNRTERIMWFGIRIWRAGDGKQPNKMARCLAFVANWMLVTFTDM